MTEDLEGDRIYLAWGWVLLAVSKVLEAEADVHTPLACEAGIYGTQSGNRLAN